MTEETKEQKPVHHQIYISYSGVIGTLVALAMFLFIVFSWKDIQLWQIIAIGAMHGIATAMAVKAAVGKCNFFMKKHLDELNQNNEELRSRNIEVENMIRKGIKSNTQIAKQLLANEEYVVSIMDSYEALIAKCKEAGVNVEEHWDAEVEKAFKDMRQICSNTREAIEKAM